MFYEECFTLNLEFCLLYYYFYLIIFCTTQYNAQFKIFEPLEYQYDVCEAILLWEQVNLLLLNLLPHFY